MDALVKLWNLRGTAILAGIEGTLAALSLATGLLSAKQLAGFALAHSLFVAWRSVVNFKNLPSAPCANCGEEG